VTGPIVVAHAGGSGHAPANTFGAYRRAHSTYPDVWMEFDAQFSADGELMSIHADTLNRTTNATGPVCNHTAEELQEVDASKGFDEWGFEPVPRVRDLLAEGRAAGWRLICEVKNIPGQPRFNPDGEEYAETLCGVIEDTDFPLDHLVVICFWPATLDAIKRQNDRIALGYLSVPELPNGRGLSARQNADVCRENGYHVSAPRHTSPDLSSEHVEKCHADGIQVHVWTTNKPSEIEQAVSHGLDGITSDYPDRVFKALSS
jgi:glycerophosphoryl diester phosphodiesterase